MPSAHHQPGRPPQPLLQRLHLDARLGLGRLAGRLHLQRHLQAGGWALPRSVSTSGQRKQFMLADLGIGSGPRNACCKSNASTGRPLAPAPCHPPAGPLHQGPASPRWPASRSAAPRNAPAVSHGVPAAGPGQGLCACQHTAAAASQTGMGRHHATRPSPTHNQPLPGPSQLTCSSSFSCCVRSASSTDSSMRLQQRGAAGQQDVSVRARAA